MLILTTITASYMELLQQALTSLERVALKQYTVVILTVERDKVLSSLVCNYTRITLEVIEIESISSLAFRDAACFWRFSFVDWPRLFEFETLLHVDADVLFLRDPESAISTHLVPRKVHYPWEGPRKGWQFSLFWGIKNYTLEQIACQRKRSARGLNAGIFAFRVDTFLVRKFRELVTFAVADIKAGREHFTDQSYVNHFMHTNEIANWSVLGELVQPVGHVEKKTGGVPSMVGSMVAIVHVQGSGLLGLTSKLNAVKKYKELSGMQANMCPNTSSIVEEPQPYA